MTSLQRQAVLVCVVCALAALLSVGITLTLLKRGKPETPGTPADAVPTDTTGDGESTDLAPRRAIRYNRARNGQEAET